MEASNALLNRYYELEESNKKLLHRVMWYREQNNDLRRELNEQIEMTAHFRKRTHFFRRRTNYQLFLQDLREYEIEQENHLIRSQETLSVIKAVLHWVKFHAENRFKK